MIHLNSTFNLIASLAPAGGGSVQLNEKPTSMKISRLFILFAILMVLTSNNHLQAKPKTKDHFYLLIPSINHLGFWAAWEIPAGKWENSYQRIFLDVGKPPSKWPATEDEWVMETISWEFSKRGLNTFLAPDLQEITPDMLKIFGDPKDVPWAQAFWDHATTIISKPSEDWPESVEYLRGYCDALTRFYGRNICLTCPCPAAVFGSHVFVDKPLAVLFRSATQQDIENYYIHEIINTGGQNRSDIQSKEITNLVSTELKGNGLQFSKIEVDTLHNFILIRTNQAGFTGLFATLFSPF